LIPFGVFGGVAVLGFVASWGIKGRELEAGDFDEGEGEESEEDGERKCKVWWLSV